MALQKASRGPSETPQTKFLHLIAIESILSVTSIEFLFSSPFFWPVVVAGMGIIKFSYSHHINGFFSLLLPLYRASLVWLLGSIFDQNMESVIFSILFANFLAALTFSLESSCRILKKSPILLFLGLLMALSVEKIQNSFQFYSLADSRKSMASSLLFEIILSFLTFATRFQLNLNLEASDKSLLQQDNIRLKNFILTLSHELRNPLNGLLGNLSLLQGEKISSQANENVSSARACGEFLLQFINNILDTGKLEAGHLEINLSRVDPRDLFKKLWRINADILKIKKLEGQFKINNLPSKIKIDPHRISQVLFNLIGNAMKFTEKGTIKVLLSWVEDSESLDETFHPIPYSDDEDEIFLKNMNLSIVSQDSFESEAELRLSSRLFSKGYLKIIVADTGVGMTTEELGRLFQKFSQVGEEKKKQLGSGLGLNIAKEICKKMGGDLRLYSRKNFGTTAIAIIPSQVLSDSEDLSEWTLEEKKVKVGAFLEDSNRALLQEYAQRIGGVCVDLGRDENLVNVFTSGKSLDAIYFDEESEPRLKSFLGRAGEFPKIKDIKVYCVGEGSDSGTSLKYLSGKNMQVTCMSLFFDNFLQSLSHI